SLWPRRPDAIRPLIFGVAAGTPLRVPAAAFHASASAEALSISGVASLSSRQEAGERHDYLHYPVSHRSDQEERVRAICAQLGTGHPALRRRSDRLLRAA